MGQAGILDEDVIHAVGIGLLHATNELGIGLDPLLLRPLPQQEVGTEEAHETDDQTPDDGHTQIAAEHQSDGQDAGGGRHQTVGQEQTQTGEGSHGGHGDVLTLGEHRGDGGRQHHGDIPENRDRHNEGRQGRSQLHTLTTEQLDKEVCNDLGGTGILDGHGNDGAKDDGDAHAAQRAAKTVADVIHGTGDAVTQGDTGTQRSNKQRQHGMHLCFDDHQHQSCDRHYQNQNEYSSRHSVFSFSDFLSDLQQALCPLTHATPSPLRRIGKRIFPFAVLQCRCPYFIPK